MPAETATLDRSLILLSMSLRTNVSHQNRFINPLRIRTVQFHLDGRPVDVAYSLSSLLSHTPAAAVPSSRPAALFVALRVGEALSSDHSLSATFVSHYVL